MPTDMHLTNLYDFTYFHTWNFNTYNIYKKVSFSSNGKIVTNKESPIILIRSAKISIINVSFHGKDIFIIKNTTLFGNLKKGTLDLKKEQNILTNEITSFSLNRKKTYNFLSYIK